VKEDVQVSLKHMLTGHQKPVLLVYLVFTMSWSHDDQQLITCGQEEVIRRLDIGFGECLKVYEKYGVGLISYGPDEKLDLRDGLKTLYVKFAQATRHSNRTGIAEDQQCHVNKSQPVNGKNVDQRHITRT
ncbi:hypothetical protein Dsin_021458, partial [Dipteronia sinensis]